MWSGTGAQWGFSTLMPRRSTLPVAEPFVLPGAHPLVTSVGHRQDDASQGLCAPESYMGTRWEGKGKGPGWDLLHFCGREKARS